MKHTTTLALVKNKLRTRPNASYKTIHSLLSEYNIKPRTLMRTYYTAKLHLELEEAKEKAVDASLRITNIENILLPSASVLISFSFAVGALAAYIITALVWGI